MNDLELITVEKPGVSSVENFDELKSQLKQNLTKYKTIVYTPDNYKEAKKDKTELTKLKRAIDTKRKEIKSVYMAPYLETEAKIKELVSLIDEPIRLINEFLMTVDNAEKAERHDQVVAYYRQHSVNLNEMADRLLESPCFYESKWDNKSTEVKTWQDEVKAKVIQSEKDISSIQATGGMNTAALLTRYFETLDIKEVKKYQKELEDAASIAGNTVFRSEEDDKVVGYKVLKISGTRSQITQIMDQMELLGIDVEEIEDGMPQDFTELHTPDFDSFVAFDIEHSGTFGAANGDVPPEITEIGAVKVVNGKVVDHFDMLANPGRKITPQNERLTHITNEMVKDKPPVSEVIKAFKEYCGDFVLVGHNIKSVDLPYISAAGRKNGIAFENEFFDTYVYAKKFKEQESWDNVKLEYLAGQFGVEDNAHHRAYNDAQVNVDVFFKLKELGEQS
ncbi:DUF1351 domain-containing protein [Anaerolactibacter massiliensis]|uniref:DUF1351 domain-containing protein n=1 Tax=Anaerolactibacter massiliensis TaxID=2044573 RepID=UPI000CFA7A41|nr:DUF1351 domain-containing protein [Anaerolactibacter massiliensis]